MAGFLVYIIVAAFILFGFIIFLLTRLYGERKMQNALRNNQITIDESKKQLHNLGIEKSKVETTLGLINTQFELIEAEKSVLEKTHQKDREEIIRSENEIKHLNEQLVSQKKDLISLQEKFKHDFENLAQKILEVNSKKFTEGNRQNIDQILKPLDLKINEFKKQVEDTYNNESRERYSLQAEIRRLAELNTVLSKEADNLTKALKGDVKKQGTWGEMILEKVLENSGLTEGVEYEREAATSTDEGLSIRPDVIVKLPEGKHIIIDSKFPLKAYNNYIGEEKEDKRIVYLKSHIQAIQTHIKLLSDKKYPTAIDKNTPDFVIMFLPVEAAFSLAISGADNLFTYAWERKIILVSPTTLLATLKTVESLWKHENQSKNALEIARQGGKLYDKFMGFLEDLTKIEKSIENLDSNYKAAKNKLKDGKGNLISKAEQLKLLGIKTEKNLPYSYNNHLDE